VKNYTVVQITYAPNTFPNTKLEKVLLKKIEPFIKSGQCTVADSWGHDPIPGVDYRYSALSNRPHWDTSTDQIFYRIFFDESAAIKFVQLNKLYGAKDSKVVTEDDIGKSVPASMQFPDEAHVRKFIWNGSDPRFNT
jgi:hypothetical protein